MMKIVFFLFLFCPLFLSAQQSEIDSILAEINRPYRDTLDKRDHLYLQQQREIIALDNNDAIVDSMISIMQNISTPRVLARELAGMIASIPTKRAIEQLVRHLDLGKVSPESTGDSSSDYEFVCFNAIQKSGRHIEAYEIILYSDYLKDYQIKGLFDNRKGLIVNLFTRYRFSKCMVAEAIEYLPPKEPKKQFLKEVLGYLD